MYLKNHVRCCDDAWPCIINTVTQTETFYGCFCKLIIFNSSNSLYESENTEMVDMLIANTMSRYFRFDTQ